MRTINHSILNEAIEYYKSIGYSYVEVPWVVSSSSSSLGISDGIKRQFSTFLGDLIASGEQGFFELVRTNSPLIRKGENYVTCTPCFRDEEKLSPYTRNWFEKVELFCWCHRDEAESIFKKLQYDSYSFHSKYTDSIKQIKINGHNVDLKLNDIEIASIGIRNTENFTWVYATGVAEPRFSTVLKSMGLNEGYHVDFIPKGKLNTVDNIKEEFYEFLDAHKQENRIMELVELSDLTLSIDNYLKVNYGSNMTFLDLMQMASQTEKAFKSGIRK